MWFSDLEIYASTQKVPHVQQKNHITIRPKAPKAPVLAGLLPDHPVHSQNSLTCMYLC